MQMKKKKNSCFSLDSYFKWMQMCWNEKPHPVTWIQFIWSCILNEWMIKRNKCCNSMQFPFSETVCKFDNERNAI